MRKDVMEMQSMVCFRSVWKMLLIALTMAFSFVAFFPNMDAYAKIGLYSFEERISRSEAIVIGKVVKTRKGFFGRDSASVQTVEVIKGNFKKQEFVVKYGQPFFYAKEDTTEFVENESYVLFLAPYESYYILVGAHNGYYHIRDGRTVRHDQKDFLLEDFIMTIHKTVEKGK